MYVEQDYVLTAQLAQDKLKQYHQMGRMNCLFCRDIESDDGGYVFAEYHINDIKKDIEELKEYVNTINNIIEYSIYCGYVEMPEYPKSFGLLKLYEDNYPLDEATVKYFKNPDGALKNKLTRKKNSNINSGKKTNVHVSPVNTKPKKEENELENLEEAMIININNIAEYAKELLDKHTKAYINEVSDIMLPYMKGDSYAIISWNIQEQDKFSNNRLSIYNYCSKIFNDTHPQYTMNIDENCIYITKNNA